MTRCTDGTFLTTDGLTLRTRTWLPDAETPSALLVIAHGLGEHIGRYDALAEVFVERGVAVTGFDHRGHGRSEGLRGHVDGFARFTADLDGVLQAFRAAQGAALPTFLYGHSMGGLISLHHNLDFPHHGLSGLILSNPLLGVAFEPPRVKVFAARILSRVLPRLRLGNELDTKLISRDPAEVRKYEEDPLVHGLLSTRLYTSMLAAIERVLAQPEVVAMATLWLLGLADGIVSAPTSQLFAGSLPERMTTVRVWPDTFHEPHHDLDRAEVLAAAGDWLVAHRDR